MMLQSSYKPVLLLHGMSDSQVIFDRLAAFLTQQGYTVYCLDLIPSNGDVGLDHLAQQVVDYVSYTFLAGRIFDLVGFSMGGIVGRYYLQRLGGLERVRRFITVASPHWGTLSAYRSQRIGCLQMRPNSDFLQDLNADIHHLERINFTSIWTPLDLVILPSISSQVPVGKNIQVMIPGHAWMVTDNRGIGAILNALAEPIRPVEGLAIAPN